MRVPLTPKELIVLLLRNGYKQVKSNNGSHQKFYSESKKRTVIVPLHAKELKKGLEQAILKQAGISKE